MSKLSKVDASELPPTPLGSSLSIESRPLVIKECGIEVSITIPLYLWPVAENVRETFICEPAVSNPFSDDIETNKHDPEVIKTLKSVGMQVTSRLLSFVSKLLITGRINSSLPVSEEEELSPSESSISPTSFSSTGFDYSPFLAIVLRHFRRNYIPNNDIHTILDGLELEDRKLVIQSYYSAVSEVKRSGLLKQSVGDIESAIPFSALLDASKKGNAKLSVIFGGQGNTDNYFSELVSLYNDYEPIIRNFIYQASLLLSSITDSPKAQSLHATRIDLMKWIEDGGSLPSNEHLLSTHLSLPIIGLTQLANYYLTFNVLGITPGELNNILSGTTGHSQGIISSVVISASETEKEFIENTKNALVILFWLGLRAELAFPLTTINPNILQDSLDNGEGIPTPMLNVSGITIEEAQKHAEATNNFLPDDRKVHLSLVNGPRSIIFSGPPQSLYGLNVLLRKHKAPSGEDQSKLPFTKRRIRFSSKFLPVTVPFHSNYLEHVPGQVLEDLQPISKDFIEVSKLKVPVYDTFSGEDLREITKTSLDIVKRLIDDICIHPVHWIKATEKLSSSTHIIDFGPAGAAGIGGLTHRNTEGTGVQVIIGSEFSNVPSGILNKSYIFNTDKSSLTFAPNWAEQYKPKLIRIASTNKVHIETQFSRLLGKPPIMVAGMTPTTSNEHFVSSVINAGYHVELAGGGQYSEKMLRERVSNIVSNVESGEGITLNILFLNPSQWAIQYPAVKKMRSEGFPMEGVCIAAGVPSPDVADDIISGLREAGIRHAAFKPSSIDTIRAVVSIAKRNPDFPIILQWTGGRGGGHHSYEDIHNPIFETYGSIRRQPNIVLVIGGGFGDSEGTLPYLTGSWSVDFNYPPMPFDGILLGSRIMVAKEALTSKSVKELIVNAAGCEDADWEKSYKGDIGGVLTVKSELGEPIHKITNRATIFWKEIDEKILSLSKEKRIIELQNRKDWIIKHLNEDYQKPYFGRKANGTPCELGDMTYAEVLLRALELLHPASYGKWIDVSLRNTYGDMIHRFEERFNTSSTPALLQEYETLDEDPDSIASAFIETFPISETQTLTQEDVFYLLGLWSQRGRKPVPFVPVIDERFDYWFKKDSLWQSEAIEAVVDQDPQRIVVLQGPVSTKFSTKVDAPVKEILDDIYNGHIEYLKKEAYNNKIEGIPTVEYLGAGNISRSFKSLKGVSFSRPEEDTIMYELSYVTSELPDTDNFIEYISGTKHTWLRALLTYTAIVHGKNLVSNPLRRVLRPRTGQTVIIKGKNDHPEVLAVYDRAISKIFPAYVPSVLIKLEANSTISVTFNERVKDVSQTHGFRTVSLTFYYLYKPSQGHSPIHAVVENRNQSIKDFYAALWNVKPLGKDVNLHSTFESTFSIEQNHVLDFVRVIGNRSSLYLDTNARAVPMDFAIVCGWESLVTAILPKAIDGDLLNLVHLSNQFKQITNPNSVETAAGVLSGAESTNEEDGAESSPLCVGDTIKSTATIRSVINTSSGKVVEVRAIISKSGIPQMEVISKFLYRGKYDDYGNTFRRAVEQPFLVHLNNTRDVAVLKSKSWVKWNDENSKDIAVVGSKLIFRLESFVQYKTATVLSKVSTKGKIFLKTNKETICIGRVDYVYEGEINGNVVLEYLSRAGSSIEQPVYFDNNGYSILPATGDQNPTIFNVPTSNKAYSDFSGDLNPIHTNPYFADLAGLPTTITHGMWTSAASRKYVESFAAENVPTRVKSYEVSFVGMVMPGDELRTELRHIGMANGKKIIKVETFNNQTNVKVIDGTAEVEQPTTAFVFTGQGSQEVGMGMDLYESNPLARDLWDQADRYMRNSYGVSIIEIVKTNPKQKTVYFGGAKGALIRENYNSMTYDVIENNVRKSLQLFPDISKDTPSYTFSHPNGLLYATQFTQPALVLMELATFTVMKSKGVVPESCAFAGHSLGEYAALASVGQVLNVESLVDVVFYRGITMQVAVPRDAEGNSDYAMCAVSPYRVGPTFSEQALEFTVAAIRRRANGLLEIVNFNIEHAQYVVAGELALLETLKLVLNKIKSLNLNFRDLVKSRSLKEIESLLDGYVDECLVDIRGKQAKGERIKLERGVATIPLPGIDVPFHSSFLLGGVDPFREILHKKLDPKFINATLLRGRYIPNLNAQPFSLSKEYITNVYKMTKAVKLKKLLDNWDDALYSTPAYQQQNAYALMIELLAHQFASPVRWIQTQDQLFGNFGVERLIEIGPSPILSNMAGRTLKIKYEAYDDAVTYRRVQLCTNKNAKEIYYDFEDPVADSSDIASAAEPAVADKPAPATTPVAVAPISHSSGPVGPVEEAPVSPKNILITMIALKLKKPTSEISTSKTLKELTNGKSTLQNELLGDLSAEFGSNALNEKAEEMPLSEISTALEANHNGNTGKVTNALINKMITSRMPAGYALSNIKNYLSSQFGFGPLRINGTLLYGLTREPEARLTSEQDAKNWLRNMAEGYAKEEGIDLTPAYGGAGGVAGGGAGGIVMNSEEFEKHKEELEHFVNEQLIAYSNYLGMDLNAGSKAADELRLSIKSLEEKLDLWVNEHGDFYGEGIGPSFTILKARHFDSYWNWANQLVLQLFNELVSDKLKPQDRQFAERCYNLLNRIDDSSIIETHLEYRLKTLVGDDKKTLSIREAIADLLKRCKEARTQQPVFKSLSYRVSQPTTIINEKGELIFREYIKEDKDINFYVDNLKNGYTFGSKKLPSKSLTAESLEERLKSVEHIKKFISKSQSSLTNDTLDALNAMVEQLSLPSKPSGKSEITQELPFVSLKSRNPENSAVWSFDENLSEIYLNTLKAIATDGVSFAGKCALVTGCGKGSIGAAIVEVLVSGGAKVIVTTSRFSKSVTEFYRSIYERVGSKGSEIVVVPWNGGSVQDVKALIDYIYDTNPKSGLGWDLDFVVPFAAISENGRMIDNIDSKSELAHRIMLVNVIRLIGEIKSKKEAFQYTTRPATVLLPLSPNHGTFGGDGLYGESKLGLESLLNKFHSESWSQYISIVGAIIGWTRGTALMASNNALAEGLEKLGALTFSTQEMAFNLAALLHPNILKLSHAEALLADINGGMDRVPDFQVMLGKLRKDLWETVEVRRAVAHESEIDRKTIYGNDKIMFRNITPRANIRFDYPKLGDKPRFDHLQGIFDFTKIVVVTGFGEVGPYGGSRTRWEMEAYGEFSLEGCIEMAWIMGFIKFHNGPLKGTTGNYCGWIDVETKESVQDFEVKRKYEEKILEHSGIRLIDPSLFNGYDPNRKEILQEVAITAQMKPFEACKEDAEAFKHQHGDNVSITHNPETDQYFVRMEKGATLLMPKALRFDRLVAGQIPSGWSAERYGVPKDIVDQVDPVTWFTLVSTAEALISSGITDPYEFYEYIHVSELGNTTGGGMGGMRALQRIFKRYLDKSEQVDILQESFINTMPAWVNMLLLSSSGPIKTPVGACATAAESVDIAVETILSGKAQVVLCGGHDDFREEGSAEFAKMKATSNSLEEFACGREPKDMCRPAADTRSGFMESHGCGVHVLTNAKLAITMGLPIRGIVACANTATDKNGRSVPAPGQGILTTSRETKTKYTSPLLSLSYRARQLKSAREQVKSWVANEYEELAHEVDSIKNSGEGVDEILIQERTAFIEKEGNRREKCAINMWSHDWWKDDSSIAPLRGSLGTFGLTIDDVGVASFHGTGTKANDYNESSIINQQMKHLGRTKGNLLPAVFQKHLTGHPKGAAAAWMLNGVLQILETGIIPGNRNLDNCEDRLKKFDYIAYPSTSIQTPKIKAGLLKSFGFGQAGGEVLIIHPDYILAALSDTEFDSYKQKRELRQAASYKYFHEAITGVKPLVRVKNAAPYTEEQQSTVYTNPLARASYDSKSGSWKFSSNIDTKIKSDVDVTKALITVAAQQQVEVLAQHSGDASLLKGVGIDVQLVSEIPLDNNVFLERNFTPSEIKYCKENSSPQTSFAGKWAAKEAVIKAISNSVVDNKTKDERVTWTKGSGAPLKDIEILREEGESPRVVLHGDAKKVFDKVNVSKCKVTISHSGAYAVAVAIASE